MRVLFHIPRKTLEAALKYSEIVSTGSHHEGYAVLIETLRLVLERDGVPDVEVSWPVSYEDACDVVSNLHDQLDEAHREISELERKLVEIRSPGLIRPRCSDCGAEGEVAGHQTCQYPQDR